jgi:hypothetical protein
MTGTSPAMSLAWPCPSLANFTSAGGHELHPCDVKSSNSTGLCWCCCAAPPGFVVLPPLATVGASSPRTLLFSVAVAFNLEVFSRSSLASTFPLLKQQNPLMISLSHTQALLSLSPYCFSPSYSLSPSLTCPSSQDLSSKGAKIFLQSWGNRDGGFHEQACASKHSPNSVTHEQVPLKYLSTFGKKKAPQEKRRKKRKRLWYLSRRQQKTKSLHAWTRRRRIYSSCRRKKHTHTHKSQNLFKISLLDSTHAQARGKRKLKK